MSEANDRQVAGDHYRKAFQHWDWVAFIDMGYHLGCATKYVTRWNKKGTPLQDLEKALHFVEKAIELAEAGRLIPPNKGAGKPTLENTERFITENELGEVEATVCSICATWGRSADLHLARRLVKHLIELTGDKRSKSEKTSKVFPSPGDKCQLLRGEVQDLQAKWHIDAVLPDGMLLLLKVNPWNGQLMTEERIVSLDLVRKA